MLDVRGRIRPRSSMDLSRDHSAAVKGFNGAWESFATELE